MYHISIFGHQLDSMHLKYTLRRSPMPFQNRLIQKKKEIILRRINSRSDESDPSKLPTHTNGSANSPVVGRLMNPVGRDRKTWNKSPITALLEQLSSADLDESELKGESKILLEQF